MKYKVNSVREYDFTSDRGLRGGAYTTSMWYVKLQYRSAFWLSTHYAMTHRLGFRVYWELD